MKYGPLKLICGAAIVCFSHSSIAALLDFTDSDQVSSFFSVSNGYGGAIDGIGFTLTSTDGNVNFEQRYDGTESYGCQGHGGFLKCDIDGAGINRYGVSRIDDEVTGAEDGVGGQTLTLSFESVVTVNRIDFLDLYVNPDVSDAKEQATVTFDGIEFDLVNATGSVGDGGYASLTTAPTFVQTIEFTAAAGEAFWDDHNNDFALAAVNVNSVSPVPLPSAIWLFGTGIIGLAGIRRRLNK